MKKKPSIKDILNELADSCSHALPEQLHTFKKDVKKNLHAALRSGFGKLDLVTREEFDAQTKVLLRTRQKMERLEKELSHLEAQLAKKSRK